MTHSLRHSSARPTGITAVELIVSVGIITILLSLVLPLIYQVRGSARKVQCTQNLRSIQQALAMYSNDYTRLGEVYPAYVTNLYGSSGQGGAGYINDLRAFICPNDDTKANRNRYGDTALKPIYSKSPAVPKDDKSDWAERQYNSASLNQQNCSYLYEFSGRDCQSYTFDSTTEFIDNSPSSFCSTYLVWFGAFPDHGFDQFDLMPWHDDGALLIDRNRVYAPVNGVSQAMISWQDAKFYQLNFGDVYCTGLGHWSSGDYPEPPPNGEAADPYDYYIDNDIEEKYRMAGYPRTWMPIVRCFWHQSPQLVDSEAHEQVLNVSLDGTIFSSTPYWERTAFKYGRSFNDAYGGPVIDP